MRALRPPQAANEGEQAVVDSQATGASRYEARFAILLESRPIIAAQ